MSFLFTLPLSFQTGRRGFYQLCGKWNENERPGFHGSLKKAPLDYCGEEIAQGVQQTIAKLIGAARARGATRESILNVNVQVATISRLRDSSRLVCLALDHGGEK
jgi:hypothetical protein